MKSICGIDCTSCQLSAACGGCAKTDGRPFGGACIVADCCRRSGTALDELKAKLITAFRALNIPDMEEITDLGALKGSFMNLEYTLPNGRSIKFWEDDRIYLGTQVCKKGSDRYYGIAADENYLMVSEYSGFGSDAEIVVFKRWNP